MEDMKNLEFHTARLAAALRATPSFGLTINALNEVVMCSPDGKVHMVKPLGGVISSKSVYNGYLTCASHLPNVVPLLFNDYIIKADGIYGVFEADESRMVEFTLTKGRVFTKMDILETLNQYSEQLVLDITRCILDYRRKFTVLGVVIESGAIKFPDQMHTAFHDLVGDEHTEETLLEEVERLGHLPNHDGYSQFVDLFVDNLYILSDENKLWLTKAIDALTFVMRTNLTVNDVRHVTVYGNLLPLWLFLNK